MLDSALDNCNIILSKNSNQLIVMYHKLRILKTMKRYSESMKICDKILQSYPNNGDVLFDKSVNLALLGRDDECLESLNLLISISNKFKIKIRNNKVFAKLQKNQNFIKLFK
jgi:tetratricopeptide (TPR) repeat protein